MADEKEDAPELELMEEPARQDVAGEGAAEGRKDDFKYIVRIASTDLDGKRQVRYALTGIKGIGHRAATLICARARVEPTAVMGYMKPDEVERLAGAVDGIGETLPGWMVNRRSDFYTGESRHLLGTDLVLSLREDVNLMRKIRCYKGIRHERGHKVRGQRTKSTGRTGAIVGVSHKKE